jgi:hypothetical protein
MLEHGTTAKSLDQRSLAGVPCGRGSGIRVGLNPAVHAYGSPLGTQEFVQALEESMDRRLVPQKGGRPVKPCPDARQSDLDFDL